MSRGAILIWYVLTTLSVIFVAVDIRRTPSHPVLKWAFGILALFAGPFAAFFYVLGCREPLRGTHEAYVSARWRQVLGSTMHCAAGDGVGIIAGAAIAVYWQMPAWADLTLEYVLGFGFGWAIFQALAMRDMAGGSYVRSLHQTFMPEFLSMNVLMAGMLVVMHALRPHVAGGTDPMSLGFWFVMSMALIGGFVIAYPINWWLVAKALKHGMITIRPSATAVSDSSSITNPGAWQRHEKSRHGGHASMASASTSEMITMTVLSIASLALGIVLAGWLDR